MNRSSETSAPSRLQRQARVIGVREGLVAIELAEGALIKNEVGYILKGEERLKAEVLRVRGRTADMQVFEDTTGVRINDIVELTGEMLSVELGPGLLGQVVDGLQNPLGVLAEKYGFFLPRGVTVSPLDRKKKWDFTPSVKAGDAVQAGQAIGSVPEGPIEHRILVPFGEAGKLTITSVKSGAYDLDTPVARAKREDGSELDLRLSQRWPVRRPVPEPLLRRRLVERLFPEELLPTTIRIIDTFFPIARGGTACIPGPFGAGKTVLQTLIARYAAVDIVVSVACGERAGEVVETIEEFPKTKDPRTGKSLMERTTIICNTSSMPVAARESSIYTGVTIGEYFRQMGLNVLLLADSTSRWAQAMRETSGRMEEIPGEEAFPAYLESSIKNLYERAGLIKTLDGKTGSLTMIGTVSPAGGNFEEPVTQSTLATVKAFLGLSYDRAYKRYFPAISPLISWSRYLDQLSSWFDQNLEAGWAKEVKRMQDLLAQGESIYQMLQVTGEEGISLEDYVTWNKATFLDMIFLQQDAFDPVDVSMPLERQKESFTLVKQLIDQSYDFKDKEAARLFFTKLTSLYRNLNYSAPESPEYKKFRAEIGELVKANAGTLAAAAAK
jgi:V/A-type H+/Na+-transporting ATPase subunit A